MQANEIPHLALALANDSSLYPQQQFLRAIAVFVKLLVDVHAMFILITIEVQDPESLRVMKEYSLMCMQGCQSWCIGTCMSLPFKYF